MKILIVEPESKGHHLILYINKLIKVFLNKNYKIHILTSKKVITSPQYKIIKKRFKNFKTHTFEYNLELKKRTFISKFIFQFLYFFKIFNKITKLQKSNDYKIIYFNHLDPFFYIYSIIGYFFNVKNISGLYLNCKFHHSFYKFKKNLILDYLKLSLFKLCLKNSKLEKIFLVDKLLKKFFDLKKIKNKKIIFVPEAFNEIPRFNKKFSRNKLKIYNNKKCILVYGAISYRKGLIELLDELSKNLKLNKLFIVVAGKIEEDLYSNIINNVKFKSLIEKKRLIIFNKFISQKEEIYFFNATDYVWLGYNNLSSNSSSGVLNLSIMAEKIIIASNRGLIGDIVKKNKIGFLYNNNLKNTLEKISEVKNLSQKIKNIKKVKFRIKKNLFENIIVSNL